MDFINPFKKNKEKEQLKQQQQYERDTVVTENAVHPQNIDEQEWQQRQAMLSEIRVWLLNQEPKFQKAFEELSGHRFTQSGKAVAIPYITPLVNINGAYQCINFVKIHDQNVMRSNYSEQRINMNLRYGFGYPLVQFIKDCHEEIGIDKTKGKLDLLLHYLFNLVEPTYYHALNDGERRHESQIHKIIETKNVLPKEEKKGLFGKS